MEFAGLIKRISPKLKGIAYRLNGHFTFMNHDDLYQEALLHLWSDFRQGKLQDKTDSYILQGCYFHLRNFIRTVSDKVSLSSLQALADEEGFCLEEKLPAQDTEEYVRYLTGKMIAEEIESQGLTERERQVLALSVQGLPLRQIGARMGISHVRVIKLRNRLKERFRMLRD
ncbi:MAG TPA: sigma-70 family RNA polymerase sigma factor [Patescibacteria group bacterium]|nr:sigma-70 family RNA polymerase sigma factor [Patescibacteria group bacterium]